MSLEDRTRMISNNKKKVVKSCLNCVNLKSNPLLFSTKTEKIQKKKMLKIIVK